MKREGSRGHQEQEYEESFDFGWILAVFGLPRTAVNRVAWGFGRR